MSNQKPKRARLRAAALAFAEALADLLEVPEETAVPPAVERRKRRRPNRAVVSRAVSPEALQTAKDAMRRAGVQ